MKTLLVGIGIVGLVASASAFAQQEPPLRAPQNVRAVPGTPESAALATRAAKAEMAGDFTRAVQLADEAMAKEPRDPWPYYDKASALAQMGRTNEAVAYFQQAEKRFANVDRWGQSVAIYGRAHALNEARRCDEARVAYREYAALVDKSDPASAEMARRYADECPAPATTPARPPAPSKTP